MADENVLVVAVHKTITNEGRTVQEAVEDAFKVNLDRHPDVSKVVAVDKGEIVGSFNITGYARDKETGRTHIDTEPLSRREQRHIEQNLDVERKRGDRSAVRYKPLEN